MITKHNDPSLGLTWFLKDHPLWRGQAEGVSEKNLAKWVSEFSTWANSVTTAHAKLVRKEHELAVNQLCLERSCPPYLVAELLTKANWPISATQKLHPKESYISQRLNHWCESTTVLFLPASRRPFETQDFQQWIENSVNCLTHIWDRAQAEEKPNVLRRALSDTGYWVMKDFHYDNSHNKKQLQKWLSSAQKAPWWDQAAPAFWAPASYVCSHEWLVILCGMPDGSGNFGSFSKQNLATMHKSLAYQNFFSSLPELTPQAAGVFSILHASSGVPHPALSKIAIDVDWFDPVSLYQARKTYPKGADAIEALISSIQLQSAVDVFSKEKPATLRSRKI